MRLTTDSLNKRLKLNNRMFLTLNTSRTAEENANTKFQSHEVLEQSRNEQLGRENLSETALLRTDLFS